MYDKQTVEHMMRLQAWRELRWVIDEYENKNPANLSLEDIVKRRIVHYDGYDLTDSIPEIDLRHY